MAIDSSAEVVNSGPSATSLVSVNMVNVTKLSSVNYITWSAHVQLVYSDMWTSPVMSIDGYKYYVIFVDYFTHYVWLYPFHWKSEVCDTFLRWKALVEKIFQHNLIFSYSDNGGEYVALWDFFATNGVSHLTSPLHIPEHNGFVERRHRHIVETGLTLLSHAAMPVTYWTYALSDAVYLINRLPTPTLSFSSPFAKLFGTTPNYTKLKSFWLFLFSLA